MKLFKKFAQLNNKVALIQNKEKFKYSDFEKFSEQISKIVKKNSIVILVAKNEIGVTSIFACINNGYCLII